MCARNETKDFHLSRVITRLRSGVSESGGRVVATSGITQGATCGVSSAPVRRARLAGGTGHGFRGARTAQPKSDRVNMFLGFQGEAVVWVAPP